MFTTKPEAHPRMADRITSLHLTPREAVIEYSAGKGTADASGVRTLEFVNNTGGLILARCDGRHTPDEIVAEVYPPWGQDHGRQQVASFLAEAHKRKLVNLKARRPNARPLPLTGSLDYYVPYHISVELTGRCNLRCTYCYNDFEAVHRGLPLDTLLRVLAEWKRLGLKSLELTGGEPLLYSHFAEVLEFCCNRFARVGVLTNGTLVDDDTAALFGRYRDRLVVGVSLDGPNAAVHDETRGVGAFDEAVAGLRRLVHAGVRVRAGMCVTPGNVYHLEETAAFAKSLGVAHFGWNPAVGYGRGKDRAWAWDPDKAMEILEIEQRVLKTHAGFIPVVKAEKMQQMEHQFGSCGMGTKNVALTPSGRIKTCLFLSESDSAADVTQEPLEVIFRGPAFRAYTGHRSPSAEVCGDCHNLTYCSGCTARAITVIEKEGRLCTWAERCGVVDLFARLKQLPASTTPLTPIA